MQFFSRYACRSSPVPSKAENGCRDLVAPEDHVAMHHAELAFRGIGRVLPCHESGEFARLVVLCSRLLCPLPWWFEGVVAHLAILAAEVGHSPGRCLRETGEDGAERPQVTTADASADRGVVLRARGIGAQFVFAQGLGMVGDRGEVQRLADALLDAVGQRDLFALREAVRDERVVHRVPEDVGIQRVGGVQMQLAEIRLLERIGSNVARLRGDCSVGRRGVRGGFTLAAGDGQYGQASRQTEGSVSPWSGARSGAIHDDLRYETGPSSLHRHCARATRNTRPNGGSGRLTIH